MSRPRGYRSVFASAVALASLLGLGLLGEACGSNEASDPETNRFDSHASTRMDGHVTSDAGIVQLDAGSDAAGDGGETCVEIDDTTAANVATAIVDDEHALTLKAASESDTSWAFAGNEALILDVLKDDALLGHLVLHQGSTATSYGMHTGALTVGATISLRVSAHSADNAIKRARVCNAKIVPKRDLGELGEGLIHAPIMIWPLAKRFDDLPVVLGWSRTNKSYALTYSNENGGTVALCGGGAKGIGAEVARWGRAFDIESMFKYGTTPTWERCTGVQPLAANSPRMESEHPVFYYGDGHNRLFESRGGYGDTCGVLLDKRADGSLDGWDKGNPGNDPGNDASFAITLRPLPVPSDGVSYGSGAPRERVVDTFAPWLYRLTALELEREGKIDNASSRAFDRYLYVDVRASDVGGTGDGLCATPTSGGFVVRATAGGNSLSGTRMTQPYFGSGTAWKRLAIPLDRAYAASEVDSFTLDAYDNDGIFLLNVGDAFVAKASGTNGSTLDYVRKGSRALNRYIDDGNSGCDAGVNSMGPFDAGFPCSGTLYTFAATP